MFSRVADQYRGSTAVVVGAGGIGGEIVRLLTPSIGSLVVADHNDAVLDQLAGQIGSAKLLKRKLDVCDSAAVEDFAHFLSTTVGAPHFFFYTAGILTVEPFAQTTARDWERAVAVNLTGAFHCSKAIADLMIPQKRGSIVLLGSIAGTKARSGSRVNPVYNVTKAGLAAFVNAASMQLRGHGVRINCISPGPTATPMMDVQPAQVHEAIREITLDSRMNHPAEVAELALFVAAHGRFTGEDVCMGGGAGLGG
ncbi:MAG: SDR family oxidoreductase [Pirellulaceae bacterium]|nr:SDR family oxidoreductase [Pirellulaceae bacterium]